MLFVPHRHLFLRFGELSSLILLKIFSMLLTWVASTSNHLVGSVFLQYCICVQSSVIVFVCLRFNMFFIELFDSSTLSSRHDILFST